jgi:hypothetical protein
MLKVKNSNQKITPFGGLTFIDDAIKQKDINQIIDNQLGSRDYRAKFSYSDIVISLLYNSLCNGEFVSDVEYLKENLLDNLKSSVPSPDTIEYVSQELKVKSDIYISDDKVINEVNDNKRLNGLLVELGVHLGLLKADEDDYTLDFDNVVLKTEKQDAKKSFKMCNAYHPNIANIGNTTVYIENRNGNSSAKYGQKKALENCFKTLKNNNIKVNRFRADSASYQKEVIDLVSENANYFYIRNISSQYFRDLCIDENVWEKVEINYEIKEVASIKIKPFKGDKEYRVVVTRTKINCKDEFLFDEHSYNYYGILTNDLISSNLEVILFYNLRGDVSENNNKNLLNDFNMSRLPFMDLDTNTVYMLMMATCSNLFEWIKNVLVENGNALIKTTYRTKRVFMRYICVCAKYVKQARQEILVIFTNKKMTQLKI